jgi:hypothetical protein
VNVSSILEYNLPDSRVSEQQLNQSVAHRATMDHSQKEQYKPMKDKYVVVNERDVLFEVFDDEVVIINMVSGTYYSISSTAQWIWQKIGNGCFLGDLVTGAEDSFDGSREELEKAIYAFVEELGKEGLIRYAEKSGGHAKPEATTKSGQNPRFDTPVIERYTDMQDLLLLDPIHEVDETGWPTPLRDGPKVDE